MARCNNTFFAILGMLNSKGPLSGYDINKIFEKTSDWYWSESNAQLYPMLKKLEESGAVVSEMCQDSGARQRRVYSITNKGLEKLISWLGEPIEQRPKREELLLKLRFGNVTDPTTIVQHLKQFEHKINGKLLTLSRIQEQLDIEFADKPDYTYIKLTIDYAEETLHAKKRWVDRAIAQFNNPQNSAASPSNNPSHE